MASEKLYRNTLTWYSCFYYFCKKRVPPFFKFINDHRMPTKSVCVTIYNFTARNEYKGCSKKCTRQSSNVLWVVLNSLFFKEIKQNDKREAMEICWRVLKKSDKSRFDSCSVRNRVTSFSLDWSWYPIIYRLCSQG